MGNFVTNTNQIFDQKKLHNSVNSRAMFWNMALSVVGGDVHGRIAPRYTIAMPLNKL